MKIAIAQHDFMVGDVWGNVEKIVETARRAEGSADLVVFSEMCLTGYPPRDLLERRWLLEASRRGVERLAALTASLDELGIVVGAPVSTGRRTGTGLYNAGLLLYGGRVEATAAKALLPTYDVFDESRYFDTAPEISTIPFKGERLGLTICEDALTSPGLLSDRLYTKEPVALLAHQKPTVFINISASPFHTGKDELRFDCLASHARKHDIPFVYANQVGGNDELIFDGRSFAVDGEGRPLVVLPAFEQGFAVVDTEASSPVGDYEPLERVESVYQALVLGLHDYLTKCGFEKAVCGMSGGIDSAVCCSLAVASLGRENVLGITMPSPYSSPSSAAYARLQADRLGIELREIPISEPYEAFKRVLAEPLGLGADVGVTLENIQARTRGDILMAFSNERGYLVLSTGNKSELSVGYCTLYGDMTGGLAPLGDVLKTQVYELAEHMNRTAGRERIPRNTITKPPSAELKPGQTDQDKLPAYDVLDAILRAYIEEDATADQIIASGRDEATVRQVVRMVDLAEYKRQQAAPVLKVSSRAFGIGRRVPIAQRFVK